MGIKDWFSGSKNESNSNVNVDEMRAALVEATLGFVQTDRGVRVEDVLSASASIVAERCIQQAGEMDLRHHDFTPGQRVFSDRVNDLVWGSTRWEAIEDAPSTAVLGTLRNHLDRSVFTDAEFPRATSVLDYYAANIGKASDWGWVPLSVPDDHKPLIPPLRIAWETRQKVDELLRAAESDFSLQARVATESLADILTQVASHIDHRVALAIAVETINAMAKTAPMTDAAMAAV